MPSLSYALRASAAGLAILAALTVSLPAQVPVQAPVPVAVPVPVLSLKVSQEAVPPGGVAQMKVLITEPRPITTGGGLFAFDGFDSIDGIAVMSPADDTYGAAVVRKGQVAVSIVSPSGTFGTDTDYPLLTVAGHVSNAAPLGALFPFAVEIGGLQFVDPSGFVYPIEEVKPGFLLTQQVVSIDDVTPGSGELPAGSVVTIRGHGFEPRTKVKFKDTTLADVLYVDDSRIDVVLSEPLRMHGRMVRVVNRDGTKDDYFSYQRTTRSDASLHPTLRDVVPLFPGRQTLSSDVELSGVEAGLAIQNSSNRHTTAIATLVSADGSPVSAIVVSLPPYTFVVKEITELFNVPYEPSSVVRLRSIAPIQMMGLSLDGAGGVTPLVPR